MNTTGSELCGTQHIRRDILIQELLFQNQTVLLNGDEKNAICYDGIVDDRQYCRSKHRLAFLLKETNGNRPNGSQPDRYEPWDYVGWIRDDQSTEDAALYPTFRNIAMWASEYFDCIETDSVNKEKYLQSGTLQITAPLRKSLRRIALINLKKTFGGGSTAWKALDVYLNQDIKGIIKEQFSLARPAVVLCGGVQVFDFALEVFQMRKDEIRVLYTANNNKVNYFVFDGMIFVCFYHPACRKSREKMFDYAADVFQEIKKLL